MTFQLKKQASGALALHNPETGETMHPGHGPWAEATGLYVSGSGLPALLTEAREGEVVVFDVGLGGAANALAAISAWEELRGLGRRIRPLRIVSFENDPEPLRFAIGNAEALGYLRGYEDVLEQLLRDGQWQREDGGIAWELRLGDFTSLIHEEPRRADVVFFDPFSPRTNPPMWSLATLEGVFACRRPGGNCRLVTYSTAFGTRAALLLAGYYVGDCPGRDTSRMGTVAQTHFSGLHLPLDRGWLGRWKRDRMPWPCLTPTTQHRQVREQLLGHPQWEHFANADPDSGTRATVKNRPGRNRPGPKNKKPGKRRPLK